MSLSDDFMRHFRWITPVTVMFSIFMLGKIYGRLEKVEEKLQGVIVTVEKIKTSITGVIE